ncbi:hypothetical protein [Acidiferrobacter sp. SPIII_3]|uniref:hypothetical protein n=1 Tax=Acidiferrobacter sp. SPIII_3 TaxID=1281578 RepID=UPI0011AB6FF7|nr:hypothetical protein [Acidiferrobacter sp. SPIII_3]
MSKIQRLYNKVSDGWWLYHAPESFIQSHLALHIAHNGEFCVYPECSPKRWKASVSRGNGTKPRGRPFSAHNKKRFDLVIWRKSGKRPRAIVEIKRAVYASPLVEDAGKIVDYGKEAQFFGIRTAYILAYSEARQNGKKAPRHSGTKKLEQRFKAWSENLREECGDKATVKCVGWEAHEPRDQDDKPKWSWGVALYRLDYRAKKKKKKRVVSRSPAVMRTRKAA